MDKNYQDYLFKQQIKDAIKEEYGTNLAFEKAIGAAPKSAHVRINTKLNQFNDLNKFLNKLKLKLVITKLISND